MARDPHQVLGLAPGASVAEVKRAYRRLAKEHHPDSAGATALPRFLEIQTAYEQLTSTAWRPGMRRPASAEPWRADPARARSTPGAGAPGGGRAGAAPGSAPGRAGPRPGTAAGAGAGTGTGRRSGSGAAAGSAPGTRSGPRPRTDGSAGRRRPVRKATFGSTTYDEARDAADPTWTGASWYGPTSGEYWQVNPREYADPRKHGPEYLARAAARAAAATERRAAQPQQPMQPPPGSAGPAWSTRQAPRSGPSSTSHWSPASDPAPDPAPPPASAPASAPAPQHGPARTPPRARPQGTDAPSAAAGTTAIAGQSDDGVAGRFGITLSPGARRIVRALAAWPPLGVAAAALIGEITGCASFDATCTAPADLYPWFAQVAIVLALLAAPAAARVLAGGTASVAVLAFPAAAVLSAGGATYDRARGSVALMAVLAVAWAAGVGAMLLRRAARGPVP